MNIQLVRKLITRLGMTAVTLGVTAFSVAVSLSIYLLITGLFGGFNRVGLIVSIVAPTVIAPICTVVILRMSLALHEAEQKLLKAHAELELRVAEQTLALRQRNEQLQEVIFLQRRTEEERNEMEALLRRSEKMEALGLLAGGVAHDLNNVLGVLVGYSELLLMEMPEGSPYREQIANIHLGGQRGAAIVQDLLTLGRRGVAVFEILDLNAIVSSTLQTMEFKKLQANRPEVTFRTDLAADLLPIKGSPVHLGKTVFNLIMNALEAIEGRGEVSLQTENRYLDRPIRGYDEIEPGDYVVLIVADNGQGISPVDIEKIFEPFYTKKVMGRSGTGLGLTVVWGTVKDHRGYIDVQSREARGSVFTLFFPVTREALPGPDLPAEEPYQGRGEFLLVVDDVEEQRKLAAAMLTRVGYQLAAVASGEAAIDFLQHRKVDLVVLDMIMDPGIDGLETYRRILEIRPRQKAVIVSGFSETEQVSQALALGAGTYVRKPYTLEKIARAVREELDRA